MGCSTVAVLNSSTWFRNGFLCSTIYTFLKSHFYILKLKKKPRRLSVIRAFAINGQHCYLGEDLHKVHQCRKNMQFLIVILIISYQVSYLLIVIYLCTKLLVLCCLNILRQYCCHVFFLLHPTI